MKNEDKYCILSVKYSITECNGEAEETTNTTKMEHVFTARDKSTLLQKIERFEDRLRERKQLRTKRNLLTKTADRISGFMDRYRHSYRTLINL